MRCHEYNALEGPALKTRLLVMQAMTGSHASCGKQRQYTQTQSTNKEYLIFHISLSLA